MGASISEENYLKAIYSLLHEAKSVANNQSLAEKLQINPASVTDMLKKLQEKKLIIYNRKNGAALTEEGLFKAIIIVRKHRLWETFLVKMLGFSWDEVHDIAEQLEHIKSDKLTFEIDKLLGFPRFDPHGDPIPNADGVFPVYNPVLLSNGVLQQNYKICGVTNHENNFLQFLDQKKLSIGSEISIVEVYPFDKSMEVLINQTEKTVFSYTVCSSLLVM